MKLKLILIAAVFILAFAAPNVRAQWVSMNLQEFDPWSLAGSGANIIVGTTPDGGGVLCSTDDGINWSFSALGMNGVPEVGAGGKYLFASLNPGVRISTDSGKNWWAANGGLENTEVLAFETIGTNIFAGTDNGVFLFSDTVINGDNTYSWAQPDKGAMSRPINAFAVAGSNMFGGGYGVFLSTDSGKNWIDKTNGLRDSSINALAAIGTNVFVATDSGIFLSTDGGGHWNLSDSGLPPYSPISYVFSLLACGNNIFAAVEGSVYLSTDTGAIWVPVYPGLQGGVAVLGASSEFLFASGDDVYRRPLSDFSNSAVSPSASFENSFTSYPNPFTQSTTITLTTPASGEAELSVVNLLGEEVAHLYDGELGAGEHSFSWNAIGLAPGMYECVVKMNGHVQQLPMVLQ